MYILDCWLNPLNIRDGKEYTDTITCIKITGAFDGPFKIEHIWCAIDLNMGEYTSTLGSILYAIGFNWLKNEMLPRM